MVTVGVLIVVGLVGPPRGGFYVSPGGSSGGDGSRGRPWDLATALRAAGGRVQPGDTIWLLGGVYHGAFRSSVSGVPGAPVVVRQYPGERAVIDGNGQLDDMLLVEGPWVVFQDFEITDSNADRVTTSPQRPHGVVSNAPHVKYVHLVVHDTGIGFYVYPAKSKDVEIYGCLLYDNGWRGGGHAVYAKSDTGPLLIRDNVIFNQFGYGIHVYSKLGGGGLRNITVRGNVSFGNGALDGARSGHANLLVGGREPVSGGVVDSNLTYYAPGVGVYNIELGFGTTQNADLVFRDNYGAGGARAVLTVGYWSQITVSGNTLQGPQGVVDLKDTHLKGYDWGGNTVVHDPSAGAWSYNAVTYGFTGWQQATGLGTTDRATAVPPSAPQVFLRKSVYEPGRATVVVYNWSRQATVPVDISAVLRPGDRYEVRSVQAFFGKPVVSGVYAGAAINLPMTPVTPPAPIGGSPGMPPVTGPDFDTFILTRSPR